MSLNRQRSGCGSGGRLASRRAGHLARPLMAAKVALDHKISTNAHRTRSAGRPGPQRHRLQLNRRLIAQAPRRAGRLAFTLLELLLVIAIIAILAALLFPALSRAKLKAHDRVCLGQLKQLGIAARLYAEDNASHLPAAELLPSNPGDPQNPLPRISTVLASYAGKAAGTNSTSTVFRCPQDKEFFFEVEGSSYQWNAALNARPIDFGEDNHFQGVIVSNGVVAWQTNGTITHAAVSTPLFLDYDEFHPRPPKSGKNVVYMDGHATAFEPLTPF